MSYVVAGWIVVVVGIVGFALLTVVQGRRLSAQVAPERRRWMREQT